MTSVAELPTTDDTLLGGRLRYRQPASGYRVGLEAPLLAAFAVVAGRRPPRAIVDLGAGPGAVGLCLAVALPSARVTLVEPDAAHAALARENAQQNGFAERISVIERAAQGVDGEVGRGGYDLVVSNPPWFDEDAGARADGDRRQGSRGLEPGELRGILAAGRQLLGRGGRLCLCFPSSSLAALLAELEALGLPAKRLRALHPRAHQPANAVFVEALAGKPGGLVVEPPWFVRTSGDAYTPEVRSILWGE